MGSRVLAFLRDEGNRALLGWIGGGLVVLAPALWAVYVHFYPAPEAKPSNSIEVHNGNVTASGPNATFNAPVNINPDAKEVVAPINGRLEKLAAQVARDKGVEIAPLRSVLGKLGEKGEGRNSGTMLHWLKRSIFIGVALLSHHVLKNRLTGL